MSDRIEPALSWQGIPDPTYRIEGSVEGVPFSLERAEGATAVLDTRRGRVQVTVRGWGVVAAFVDQPDAVAAQEHSAIKQIEPALSAEEWADLRADDERDTGHAKEHRFAHAERCENHAFGNEWAKVIAVANDALPDSDPGKITRDWVRMLRVAAYAAREGDDHYFAHALGEHDYTDGRGERIAAQYDAMADALESYLPPETTTP